MGGPSRQPRRTDTRYIEYRPWPTQRAFHVLKERYKGFSGPIRSGKSVASAQEALKLCYVNAGCTGLLGAPTYRMLEDVLKKTFIEVLVDNRIPFEPRWTDNKLVLTECASEVLFRSAEVEDRLRGTTLAWFGLDELTYIRKSAWEVLEGRLSAPRARLLEGFGCWTPKGFDWVYNRFIGPKRLPGFAAVRAMPAENQAVLKNDPDYYRRLQYSYDDKFYRQEVLGEYLAVFSGQVYHAFDRAFNVTPCVVNPTQPLLWTLDFNVDPMCSAVAQIDETSDLTRLLTGIKRRTLRVVHEFAVGNADTRKACDEFGRWAKRFYHGRPLVVYVYGDASGHSRQTTGTTDWAVVAEWFELNREFRPFFRVPRGNPPVKNRVNAVNSLLCNYAGERNLLVDPACERVIRDFEQVTWDVDSRNRPTGDIDKHADHELTHISDAIGYLVEEEFGVTHTGPKSTVLL